MQRNFISSILTFLTICLIILINQSCKTEDPNRPKQLPVLTTTAITKITQNTATSGGFITSDGGFEVIARGVCWSLKPNPTINDSTTKDAAGTGEFTSSISKLIADTTYYVRAYATNSDGTAYGIQLSFKTLVSILPVLTTTPITDINLSSAASGGNITFNGGTAVTARGICWSTTLNPTIMNSKTIDGSGTGSFLSTISGLNQATNYYLRAYATNSAGTAYGNELSFKTSSIYEDGFYITGNASAYSTIDISGQFKSTPLEQMYNQVIRAGLVEKYVALERGKTFTITEVDGANINVYGPGGGFTNVVQSGGDDEMAGTLQKGNYTVGGTFSVPTSGLYQVVIDKQTRSIVIMPVSKWAIIGSATPLGWSDNDMPSKGTFSKDTMVFEATNITLLSGEFKFRHSGAWKQTIVTDPSVKVYTTIGGTSMNSLVSGGANIPFVRADNGKYTVTATWGKSTGLKFRLTKTGTVVIAEYPSNLYMIGESIGGWDWTGAYIITMNPVHSHPHAFWAIAYINASTTDGGFKFAPGKEWKGDFGITGTATSGIYAKGTSNITTTSAGYYMVYVDLKAEKVSVTAPKVYLIGDAISAVWDYAAITGLFIVDNTAKTITSPVSTGAGSLRMYATCPLSQLDIPKAEWWQMEFNVINGRIEYRGIGSDQTVIPVTVGKKVVLNFSTKTGVIR